MKFTIPFIADKDYIRFIQQKMPNLSSVYYPLNTGPVLDARSRFKAPSTDELLSGLKRLGSIKKYCLLNTRFIHPEQYRGHAFMDTLTRQIFMLYEAGCIDGIVINDFYLLNRMRDTEEKIFLNIEAVPGANSMLDSVEKCHAMLEMIEQAGFKPPSKIIADRSLNRQPEKLADFSARIKKHLPSVHIELLANEGCIYQCPFKLSHDAQISLANTGLVKEMSYLTNRTVGCRKYFFDAPNKILKSPFIRPEDIRYYEGVADTIKICGRTLGTVFLKKTVTAYINQDFDGNLLELMDASGWFADHYFIDNKKLDPGFLKTLTSCTNFCKPCSICDDFFKQASHRRSLTLKPYKDFL